MLKALLGVRMTALGSFFTGAATGKKAPSKGKLIGFSLLMLYSFAALTFMFWHYFSSVAQPFHMLGLDWLYYSLTGVASFSVMFIGSVFFAKAQLYEAKDNELLLSMPVPPGNILLSRTVMLLVVTAAFGLPAIGPAIIIGISTMSPSPAGIAAMIALFVLLPVFTLAMSALFGWLLSIVTARVKHKSLFGTLLCVAAIVGYSLLVGKVNTAIMDIAAHADAIAGSLGGIAPVYWFGSAMGDGRVDRLLVMALIFVAVAGLTYVLLSATFIRTATTRRGFAKTRYVEKQAKSASADAALLRRELARLGSSSAYIMNAAMGAVMLVIGCAVLLIKRRAVVELLSAAPELASMLPAFLILGLCLFSSMNLVSAPAVSLEGKNLWIVQSMPVEAYQALRAKLRVHLLVCLPPIILAALLCVLILKPSAVMASLLVAVPSAMTVFIGLLGLAEGLRHPNLDWANEAQAVKTSFGVLFTMLISWGVIALPALAVLLLGDMGAAAAAAELFLAALVIASLLLRRWLKTRGAELFRQL